MGFAQLRRVPRAYLCVRRGGRTVLVVVEESSWTHVDYQPGTDEFWDSIGGGDTWGAIDGVAPGVRVYATWGEQPSGRMVVTGICARGSADQPLSAEVLRAIPIGRLAAGVNEHHAEEARRNLALAPKLHRPSGDDPEGFYKAVATHYRWHAALGNKPAADIAEAAGVPVGTAHRWIREARIRGFLPKGRQGAVG